ncbi:CreA family protein [Paraburkholderia sp. LEh10]|uniref:CreA family protein n=1 Tax=Paraburkholderia sp. LEh10 TaxID=2821353 RepID=UPI001AE271C6|nr:CreA family protein [Paraburkholderia sp. LEh10]MBP0593398.1 CreA family protein [Paraburkholderia sp. LEh10]
MARRLATLCTSAILATCMTFPVAGEELARIATHSHRYGGEISILAFDDPLLKGVTCYLSRSHDENSFRDNAPTTGTSDAEVSCHQVGKLEATGKLPRRAQVFDASTDPIFSTVHVFRILDPGRLAVVYFSYTENELSGNLPGHVDMIRLPMRGKLMGE